MSDLQSVPFSKLIASDEINARGATKDGLEELAASILAKGIIQPLAVRPADAGCYEVIDGRRRFQAIAKLVRAKKMAKSYAVPVIVRNEDDADALETSLAANIVRLPMHPVDQHAVFSRLSAQGRSDAEIASRFGIQERTVRQQRALGELAPEVRNAWRKGDISDDVARAFTVNPNQELQAEVLKRVLKRNDRASLSDWLIRKELMPNRVRASDCPELTLVGEEAYRAAGGTITDDLFADERYVDDEALVRGLAFKSLEEVCKSLIADGWSWAEPRLEDYHGAFYDWQCADIEPADGEQFTADEKARSGCIVSLDEHGQVEISDGLIKPAMLTPGEPSTTAGSDDAEPSAVSPTPGSGDAGDAEADEGIGISGALRQTITTGQTQAIATIVGGDFELALRLALAAFMSNDWTSPIKIQATSQAPSRPPRREFADVWPTVQEMSYGQAMQTFANLIAGCVSVIEQLNVSSPAKGARALVAALPPDKYAIWAREAFLAADFFKRAPRDASIAAINEMAAAGCIADPPANFGSGKKAEVAQLAAEHAVACGWLPPDLRHPQYQLEPSSHREAAE